MTTCIKGNVGPIYQFDFKQLLTPEEMEGEINKGDISFISSDDKNRYPYDYLQQYKNKIKQLINFDILDTVCYDNTEIVIICNNVPLHNDRRDSIPEKIYFLNTMLKGSGVFKIHHSNNIIQILELKEGDVFLFDPNIYHSFENTSYDICYVYSLSVILN